MIIIDFLKKSKYYLTILVLLGFVFFVGSKFFGEYINMLDQWFIDFISTNVVNVSMTNVMKIVTNLGGVVFLVLFLVMIFLFNKRVGYLMSTNLMIAYVFSVVFKIAFRRSRPLVMLIDRPFDYSFPSGHTLCSVVFYGFLIYVVSRVIENVDIRRVINIILVVIMILVPFSRLYLGVHYFSDIVAGALLGMVCLLCFINYVKIKELL